MNSEIVSKLLLAEIELARKRRELAFIQTELADRELFLANIRAELAAFEGHYLRKVGVLYAELDDWRAKIADLAAEIAGTENAKAAAAQARAQAEESYAAAHGEAAKTSEFRASPEVDRLFREVARQIHPDLTEDEADRSLRTRLMAEANLARERGDVNAIRKILEEYRSSPESIKGEGIAAELQRVLRQIERIKARLSQIEVEVRELTSSEIAMLMAKVNDATARSRDLLGDMANDLRKRIASARREFEEMSSEVNADERW